MKRPLGTIGIALALFALVGGILLARWLLWFGPGLPDRDYAADFHEHAMEINGVTAEEGAAGWAAFEAMVDAVVAAAESVTGEPAWQPDGSLRLDVMLDQDPQRRAESTPMLEALEQHEAYARLDDLEAAPHAVRPPLESITVDFVKENGAVRTLGRALVIRLREAIMAGDAEAAARAIGRMRILSRAMRGQPTLIERLVGDAIHSLGDSEIRTALIAVRRAGEPASGEMTEALAAALADQPPPPSLADTLEGERLFALAMIADTLPADGAVPFRPVSRGAQASAINEAYTRATTFAEAPATERWGKQLEQPEFGRMDVMAAILVPSFEHFARTTDQVDLSRHATILMLHIERHIASAGAPPASLDELNLPPEALHDPWSGEPYGYRTLTDDPHGRPYLLWAVGANGKDDGGAEHPEGNDHAFRNPGVPADWIVNHPRPAPDQ